MKTFLKKIRNQKGFAATLATLVVMATLLAVAGSLATATYFEQKIAKNAVRSAQAYYSAESGVEDTLYRIVKGKTYFATNSLTVGSSTASISVTDSSNQKIIRVNGEQSNRFRSVQTILNVNSDIISFHYGVQVGEGGLIMSNNSRVNGNIYSNGDVSGGTGAVITGDVWVATQSGMADQQSPVVDSDYVFGRQSPETDAAQSFIPSATQPLVKVSLYIKKSGTPSNKTVRILTDNGNKPSKTMPGSGAYGTLQASLVSSSNYDWIDVPMNSPTALSSGAKYWILVDSSNDSNNYFIWGKDSADAYANGTAKYSSNWNASSPSWSAINADLGFKAWLGSTPNSLSSIQVNGNAHANTITGCQIGGDAYYQAISGSTVSGTSYPGSSDPSPQSMPVSAANIADWKADAETGGAISSYSLSNGATASMGPKKINGNLTLSNNAELTITGNIYVTGTVNISNGAKLRLGSGYGSSSGLVMADGAITISNNAIFYNNGPGTYLMLLSNASGNAITVANNAQTVIFYASQGNILVSNNAQLKEASGYGIELSNGAQVTYESGLSSISFTSGSGASWNLESWQEVP